MKKLSILLFVLFLFTCSNKDQNTAKLSMPQLLPLVANGSVSYFYLTNREIDTSLTPNCGVASPNTTGTGVGSSTAVSSGSTGTSTTNYIVSSTVVFKTTGENLSLRFFYSTNQFQGNITPQQGFLMTGGIFNETVTGTIGTVKWNGQGVGYINSSTSGSQTLSFFDLNLSIQATFTPGSSATSQPQTCYTDGQGNCTTMNTGVTCYTTDLVKCIASTSTTGTPIIVTGSLNCNSPSILSN